jgi:hydroxymethylglutaryl-CoA reductase
MNGISAVVLATGNDTRAVEAGAHSHAISPAGLYTSLSRFEKDADGNIVGTMEPPMPVGLVGGATRVHPVAQAAVALLGVSTMVTHGLLDRPAAVPGPQPPRASSWPRKPQPRGASCSSTEQESSPSGKT